MPTNIGWCSSQARKKANSLPPPQIVLNGTELKRVHSYKYLGITITSNLSWTQHITERCNKTRLIGLMYRWFHQYSSPATLTKLYCSFIRPHLEYASIVWNPSLKGEVDALENVQKFALRMCTKQWNSSYYYMYLIPIFPWGQMYTSQSMPFIQDNARWNWVCGCTCVSTDIQ